MSSIDDIYGENVSDMLNPGCFLVVIKRKEMVQFDSLFMIKVAESKGLFGDPKAQQPSKQESVIDQSIRQSLQSGAQKRAKRVKVGFAFLNIFNSITVSYYIFLFSIAINIRIQLTVRMNLLTFELEKYFTRFWSLFSTCRWRSSV